MNRSTPLPAETIGVPGSATVAFWLDRAIQICLFAFVIFAPHSIAATQAAWLLGLTCWVIRLALRPRRKLFRAPVDYPLLGFFILTCVSAFCSYEPIVSIDKLRGASLFTIVYLFAQNIPSRRVLRLLALALVGSCMLNVAYTFGQRLVGRGVKVEGVAETSPLWTAGVREGDTLLEVDGQKLRNPEQLAATLESAAPGQTNDQLAGKVVPASATLRIYRYELYLDLSVPRGRLLEGSTALARLGVSRWWRGRDWRAAGFYSHYATYAEVLQLIGSLTLALLVSLPHKRSRRGILLAAAVAGMTGALLLTVTRASWLAFLISAAVIFALSFKRQTLVIAAGCALPLIVAGLLLLHQERNVGFFDPRDASTTWRETVWQEGFHLLISNPRHLVVGVGMDSIQKRWGEWGMFDNGRLPVSHLHSNFLQIAVERGVPALIVWLILIGVYLGMLWRLVRSQSIDNWIERGIVLGALGGLIGFFVSGLVHYNWGTALVIMVFYLMMGLSLAVERHARELRSQI